MQTNVDESIIAIPDTSLRVSGIINDKSGLLKLYPIIFSSFVYFIAQLIMIIGRNINVFKVIFLIAIFSFKLPQTLAVWPVRDCGAMFLSTETKD
jgi:hypothetical protein